MDAKFINTPISNPLLNPDLFWLDKSFKPVSEVFPCWLTAEPILEDYVSKLGDWTVSGQINDVDIGPKQPTVRDLISGELIPMWLTFPIEDRPLFIEIYQKCVRDFLPSLDDMLGQKLNQNTLSCIESMIKGHHYSVKASGGPEFKDWLRYNLGLYSGYEWTTFYEI